MLRVSELEIYQILKLPHSPGLFKRLISSNPEAAASATYFSFLLLTSPHIPLKLICQVFRGWGDGRKQNLIPWIFSPQSMRETRSCSRVVSSKKLGENRETFKWYWFHSSFANKIFFSIQKQCLHVYSQTRKKYLRTLSISIPDRIIGTPLISFFLQTWKLNFPN